MLVGFHGRVVSASVLLIGAVHNLRLKLKFITELDVLSEGEGA
jgi:hypothetical protein